MTVIRPNSISGVTSITALANEINVFRHNGVLAGLQLNGVNHHTSAGISTFHTVNVLGNLDVAGVLTYQDVTNVDSLGIGTFRTGINVSGGQLDVGSNIKLGNAGVITATSFVGSGAQLTGITQTTINSNTNNYLITGTGTANTLQGEVNLRFDGATLTVDGTSTDTPLILTTTNASGSHMRFQKDGSNKHFIGSGGGFGLGDVDDLSLRTVDNIIFGVGTSEKLRITSGGIIKQFASGGDNQFVSKRTGATYSNGDYYFYLFAQNNGGTNVGSVGIVRDTGNDNSRIMFSTATGGTNAERLRITSGGNLITYNNHTSGTSAHQNTGWYGDDANHYTLEYKDFNEIRAVKTLDSDTYSSIVYKREMMTEYCDIEFTLKGNAPSGTNRHTMFVINGDGSDTFSNYDRLVFRYRPGDTSGNQIRLDKGGGGTGFSEVSSSVPNFFDGNERHVHIQIRKRTFSITVNRMGQSEYNYNARNSADLVSPRGYFGFSLYERASHGTPELTIRDFKITNYTQNALPAQSVAFQAEIANNVSKSSGQVVKPANNEVFDNGYGGNYNTSNYRFTAPVAGMYQFSNTHNVYSSPNGQWAGIKVNGSTLYVGNKINSMPGSGDHNMTCYAIIQLQPGDYVEAIDYTNNAQTYSGSRTWNRFEGALIAAFK